MKLVSIIIPVYNSEKYISRCIESIINQSYKNLEILCIDDGSSDSSLNLIKDYANKDNRIKIYSQSNNGPSVARNYGLNIAIGDYIMFVDSDDYIHHNMVELLINSISRNNTMVLCNNMEIYNDKSEDRELFENLNKDLNKNLVIEEIAKGKAGLVCGKLFNKSIVDKFNIRFKKDITMCEDQIFFLNIAMNCEEFIHIPKSLYYYDRCNENSITIKYNSNAMDNQLRVLTYIEELLEQSNLEKSKINQIINKRFMESINYCINNEVLDTNLMNIKQKIKNIERIINNKKINYQITNIQPSSFREQIIINSFKRNNFKFMYYALYILDKVINPVRFQIKKLLKR